MSEVPKKRGRPANADKSAADAARVAELENALANAQRTLDAMQAVNRFSDKPVVRVRHSGYGPQLILPIEGGKPVVLDPKGPKSKATIPLADYLNLETNKPWIRLGYMYAEGREGDNPNLILNVEAWLKGLSEDGLAGAVEKIDSSATLNMLYNYTEQKRSAKVLLLRNVVARRLEKVLDIVMVEDPGEETGPTFEFLKEKRQ